MRKPSYKSDKANAFYGIWILIGCIVLLVIFSPFIAASLVALGVLAVALPRWLDIFIVGIFLAGVIYGVYKGIHRDDADGVDDVPVSSRRRFKP